MKCICKGVKPLFCDDMINFVWIFLVILQCIPVAPRPSDNLHNNHRHISQQYDYSAHNIPKYEEPSNLHNDQVISVRITSSVAVGKRKSKPTQRNFDKNYDLNEPPTLTAFTKIVTATEPIKLDEDFGEIVTDIPPNLIGANVEFLKQLNAKKELKSTDDIKSYLHSEPETKPVLGFQDEKQINKNNGDILRTSMASRYGHINDDLLFKSTSGNDNLTDTIAEPSLTSEVEFGYDLDDNVPLARSALRARPEHKTLIADQLLSKRNVTGESIVEPLTKAVLEVPSKQYEDRQRERERSIPSLLPSSEKYFPNLASKSLNEKEHSQTTVSFSIVHDPPTQPNDYKETSNTFDNVNNSPKIYSQPAKVYSEPAKFYSEPAKIYSEPAKIYSEPAKVYSEPAKIYSEPAKFYSPPASLHLPQDSPPNYTTWQQLSQSSTATTTNTTPITTISNQETSISTNAKTIPEHQPERNYEVDEKISVMSDGRIHGVQESSTTEKCKQDNCKVGYVVEGRQYKKYRVEERTSDGFIVGEYGVVRNEDGALRGVRYTADSDASPRLIYDALMKFLQLK